MADFERIYNDIYRELCEEEQKDGLTDEELLAIASEVGMPKVDMEQLRIGTELEKDEHSNIMGNDKTIPVKIALAHLAEIPDYYTRLKAMEDAYKADQKSAPESEQA